MIPGRLYDETPTEFEARIWNAAIEHVAKKLMCAGELVSAKETEGDDDLARLLEFGANTLYAAAGEIRSAKLPTREVENG